MKAERLPMGEFQEQAWHGQWAVGCGESRQRLTAREPLDLSEQAGLEENPDQGQGPDPTQAP